MIETWRTMLNKVQKVGRIMIDLSKALDSLKHILLLKTTSFRFFILKNSPL